MPICGGTRLSRTGLRATSVGVCRVGGDSAGAAGIGEHPQGSSGRRVLTMVIEQHAGEHLMAVQCDEGLVRATQQTDQFGRGESFELGQ